MEYCKVKLFSFSCFLRLKNRLSYRSGFDSHLSEKSWIRHCYSHYSGLILLYRQGGRMKVLAAFYSMYLPRRGSRLRAHIWWGTFYPSCRRWCSGPWRGCRTGWFGSLRHPAPPTLPRTSWSSWGQSRQGRRCHRRPPWNQPVFPLQYDFRTVIIGVRHVSLHFFSISCSFLDKIANIVWHPLWCWHPRLGNPGSATINWRAPICIPKELSFFQNFWNYFFHQTLFSESDVVSDVLPSLICFRRDLIGLMACVHSSNNCIMLLNSKSHVVGRVDRK